MCVCVCVCVWGQRLEPLITHTYRCPHCQNRTASIPLLFGSKLEQWKWVNSSELHLVSFPSHVCELFGCMGEQKKKRENVPLPASFSEQHCLFSSSYLFIFFFGGGGRLNFLLFSSATVCIIYIGDLYWEKVFTDRKHCQNCAQLVANDPGLLINCMFVYSLLTLKWAKKYRVKNLPALSLTCTEYANKEHNCGL